MWGFDGVKSRCVRCFGAGFFYGSVMLCDHLWIPLRTLGFRINGQLVEAVSANVCVLVEHRSIKMLRYCRIRSGLGLNSSEGHATLASKFGTGASGCETHRAPSKLPGERANAEGQVSGHRRLVKSAQQSQLSAQP